jgi:5'-3' exoribonuclease 2
MAIDGVAPRAKMNQQRSRRFRSAKEDAEKALIEEKIFNDLKESGTLDEGEVLEEGHTWDKNQITPGTPFMKKVSDSLRYYVTDRLTNDRGWKDVTVILSC